MQDNKLPYSPSKAKILELYNDVPAKRVLNRLNTIALEFSKKIGEEYNPNQKIIDRKVFVEFVQTYGLPKGYQDEGILKETTF